MTKNVSKVKCYKCDKSTHHTYIPVDDIFPTRIHTYYFYQKRGGGFLSFLLLQYDQVTPIPTHRVILSVFLYLFFLIAVCTVRAPFYSVLSYPFVMDCTVLALYLYTEPCAHNCLFSVPSFVVLAHSYILYDLLLSQFALSFWHPLVTLAPCTKKKITKLCVT